MMRKAAVIFLGLGPGIPTLHIVQMQQMFFEKFDFSDSFINSAQIVLLLTPLTLDICIVFARWKIYLHTAFCIGMTGWACIYVSCWHVYTS